LVSSVFTSPLYIGTNFAIFKESGNKPSVKAQLKCMDKGYANTPAAARIKTKG